MSANRGYVMVCYRCRARTVIRTDWNGRLVEDKGVCTCSAVVVERAPKGPELELKTCACGKPCRFKMCLDCSNAKQKASDRNRKGASEQGRTPCLDCGEKVNGFGDRCPDCKHARKVQQQREYTVRHKAKREAERVRREAA